MDIQRPRAASAGITVVLLLVTTGTACSVMERTPAPDSVSPPPSFTLEARETLTTIQPSTARPMATGTPTQRPTAHPTVTGTPTPSEYAWWTTPAAPVATCSIETVNVTPVDYPLALVQPGHTTKEQIRQILGPPDSEAKDGDYWYYDLPLAVDFDFEEEIVVIQCEFRHLEEILAWYGAPEQVIWELPKLKFEGAVEWTYLLFSERERFCSIDRWVPDFQNDEDRFQCCFYTPEWFDKLELKYPTTEESKRYWIVKVDWPCPDF